MLPNDFCHYLLGVTEMSPTLPPTPEQWRVVTTRLDSVFNKVTPNRTPSLTGDVATCGLPPIEFGNRPGPLICAPSRDGSFFHFIGTGVEDFASISGRGPMLDLTSGDMTKVTVEAVHITC